MKRHQLALWLTEEDRFLLEDVAHSIDKNMSETLRELIHIGHELTEESYEEKKYEKRYKSLIEHVESLRREALVQASKELERILKRLEEDAALVKRDPAIDSDAINHVVGETTKMMLQAIAQWGAK